MLYVIGTDEAGYGPHLGPLVISATLWQLDDPATRRRFVPPAAEGCDKRPGEGDRAARGDGGLEGPLQAR